MSRLISRAEGFERVYEAFDTVNFTAFDYATVKQSLLDYIKLTFPESFNDFIESSELVAIIETFAYVAELLAYRIDVAAHENFLPTAQRKDSILRLAKLISYTASRPKPARGLVKLTSITTSESVVDANGTQLANKTIVWNDPSNPSWKEQFLLVMNRVLDQDVGNVSPTDRFQIQDVLFEMYSLSNNSLANGVFGYSAVTNGRSVPMELVPVEYDVTQGIIERRPQNAGNFTLLYGTDGNGDGSSTTGFFCYTKQGTLQKFTTTFDGITPTQTYTIPNRNINDTDVWVNQINPTTGETLDEESGITVRRRSDIGKSGEWVPVDVAHAQNITFNTNPRRNKYEVETRDQSQVRLIFGDGEFADIPGGTFDIWARSSVDEDITISSSAVVDESSGFAYVDSQNQTQTCSFTFSLVNSLQNASAAESIEHVRSVAPAVYYTQDRMVNGKDYNVFLLQDPSIIKLRAVNRTFAGDSKYITWHDSSNTYENVKIFGNDGYLYFEDQNTSTTTSDITVSELISSYVEPLLSSTDIFVRLTSEGIAPADIRRIMLAGEKQSILDALTAAGNPASASLYFRKTDKTWFAISGNAASANPVVDLAVGSLNAAGNLDTDFWTPGALNPFIQDALIIINQPTAGRYNYTVTRTARRLTFESPTTMFWNTNSGDRVVNYDSLRSETDQIVVFQANSNHSRTALLQSNINCDVLGTALNTVGVEAGLPNQNKIIVIPADENLDNIPDNIDIQYPATAGLADVINPKITVTLQPGDADLVLTLPTYYVVGASDVSAFNITQDIAGTIQEEPDVEVSNIITVVNPYPTPGMSGAVPVTIVIEVTDYVYFTRPSISSDFIPVPPTVNNMSAYIRELSTSTSTEVLWTRRVGRHGLNFMWTHTTPRYYLVDPSPTNIVDMFVITKGFFTDLRRWIQDPSASAPRSPTPLDLRNSYNALIENKMVSDTVVLHPGRIKLMFGDKAPTALRGTFKVVRSSVTTLTDNQVKATVVSTIRNFFDISRWEFGETFYVTELIAAIHYNLRTEISSVVLVPSDASSQFGDLFQVTCQDDEVLYADINVEDVEIVTSYTPINIRLNG